MSENILEIFEKLKEIMTVSGYEALNAGLVRSVCLDAARGFFDSAEITKSGSILLYHKSEKPNARTLLIDAHIDTIGLCVSQLLGGGFLRCTSIGGIDRRILVTSEIEIYGKKIVKGIFSSIPPHLANKNGDGTLPEFCDFLVDTGLSDKELSENVSVGDPAMFCGKTSRLLGDRIASAHLDDKICCAVILDACSRLCNEKIDCNVIVLLSSGEETREGGAKTAAFIAEADGAVALDVNFAKEKGVPDYQSSKIGDGAMISRSAVTDRRMTDILIGCAEKSGVRHKVIAEVEGTGTNADTIEVSRRGTPCAVLSVPIKYMHTPCELCSLFDAECASDILVSLMRDFDKMSRKKDTLLGVRILKGGEGA